MQHCPSRDWDRFIESEDRAAAASVAEELRSLAATMIPHISIANPKLATEDAAEWCYELAAAVLCKGLELENALTSRNNPDDWASGFWRKHADLVP